MYTLAVRRDFIARHFLVGGDWVPENHPNSHHYTLELRLSGAELNQHGYLCDIVDVAAICMTANWWNICRLRGTRWKSSVCPGAITLRT